MFVTSKSLASVVALFTLAFAAGCSHETGEEMPADDSSFPHDPKLAMSAEGLTLAESSPDHVSGSFARDGVALTFDLSREADKHHVIVSREGGETLFESTLENGYDTSVYFGGKATAKGQVGAEIDEKTGDDSVFSDLASSPEGKLVPQLKEALIAAGIDRDLFTFHETAKSTASVSPQSLLDWRIISYNQSVGFWSWSFWGTTTVALESYTDYYNGFYAAYFRAGSAGPEYVSGRGHANYYRMWWGAYVTVGNNWAPLCGVYWPYTCQDTRMWVTAY